MKASAARLWETWFLEERPSLSLGLFRVALAASVGLHVLPTLLHLQDNYLSAAFREHNASFFTYGVLARVDAHPDWLIRAMAWLFAASWLSFLLGLYTRASAILTALGCYYFYARNSLHIGTLSYDILLVTLFLALATDYLGDSFSLDSARRADPAPFCRKRPFFLQRLLQIQVASTYFYTGLRKVTAGGNWLTENPYYYLMHDPPTGVMKSFPLRDFLAASPGLCYLLGLACVAAEITLPLWLFWRKTRVPAVAAAILFQGWLLLTMHVPTIFFFLFPPQLLLFIDPERLVSWLDSRRAAWARRGRHRLLYDGACGLCRVWAARLQALDPTGRLEPVDFRDADLKALDSSLSLELCAAGIQLLERGGALSSGFQAFRRLSLLLPLCWPAAPFLHLPGMKRLGVPAYDWIAHRRFWLSVPTGRR